MTHLFQALAQRVDAWRTDRYSCPDYPAIREILEFAQDEQGQLRYLRRAQFRALETYWYLRLVLNTPRIVDLYAELFPGLGERLQAMGVSPALFAEANFDYPALVGRIAADNAFVRRHGLESLRETLSLDYPSYILALAMGAGKTILMGSIVATEFALAQEYPDGPFVENALIFAPGKTILGALRELADVPYEHILPPRLFKPFAASNRKTLEDQLAETYGTSLRELDGQHAERIEKEIRLHKPQLPPLLIRKRVLRFRRKAEIGAVPPAPTLLAPHARNPGSLPPTGGASAWGGPAPTFAIPDVAAPEAAAIATYTIADTALHDDGKQAVKEFLLGG